MLTSSLSSRIRSFIAAGLILVQATLPCLVEAQPATQPSTTGIVDSFSGDVYIMTPPSTVKVRAKAGDSIGPGSVIVTDGGGEAILLFPDGQHIVMSENSELRVDDYRYDPKNHANDKAAFSLLDGTMRVVTGAMHLANRNSLTIAAGDVSIGVLSTEVSSFIVGVHKDNAQDNFAAAIAGQLSVANKNVVSPNRSSVPVAAQQFVSWNFKSTTMTPQGWDAAPPELKAAALVAAGSALDEKTIAEIKKLLDELESPAAGQEDAQRARLIAALVPISPGLINCAGTSRC